jgi:hypothetical protein
VEGLQREESQVSQRFIAIIVLSVLFTGCAATTPSIMVSPRGHASDASVQTDTDDQPNQSLSPQPDVFGQAGMERPATIWLREAGVSEAVIPARNGGRTE